MLSVAIDKMKSVATDSERREREVLGATSACRVAYGGSGPPPLIAALKYS